MRNRSESYFQTFHSLRLDDIREMISAEMWQRCPTSPDFSLKDLAVSSYFHSIRKHSHHQNEDHIDNQNQNSNIFQKFNQESSNPFSQKNINELLGSSQQKQSLQKSQNLNSDEDENIDEQLKQDFIDEDEDSHLNTKSTIRAQLSPNKHQYQQNQDYEQSFNENQQTDSFEDDLKGPILTSVSINIVKFIGKYIKLMEVLQPISMQIFVGLTELYEAYLFSVYNFFATSEIQKQQQLQSQLQPQTQPPLTQQHHHHNHNYQFDITTEYNLTDEEIHKIKAITQKTTIFQRIFSNLILSPDVISDLNSPEELYGLRYRIISIESVIFIQKSLLSLKDRIQELLGKQLDENPIFFQKFFTDLLNIPPRFQKYMYQYSVWASANFGGILHSISSIKWESGMMGAEHSPYVNEFKKEIVSFARRLDFIDTLSLPKEQRKTIWDFLVLLIMKLLIEGYSRAKKCSNEGRALMSLDLSTLQSTIKEISKLNSIPYVDLVDNYIKAFYLPSKEFIRWVRKNLDKYPEKQVANLLLCGIGQKMKRKERQEYIAKIQSIYQNQRRDIIADFSNVKK
eukprot:Anaeramoba_ignava/a1611_28.p1 GENE.a1611_28~~a1611_28.p1  ORF type:complete len:568 (-),score=178.78 a1611_28:202-1905(-)